jgi:hypothetical protein
VEPAENPEGQCAEKCVLTRKGKLERMQQGSDIAL